MHPGTISINRRSDGKIVIEIRDSNSLTGVLQGTMDAHDFGEAVVGLAERPIEFDVHAARVGQTRETKTITLALEATDGAPEARQALQEYLVDGWGELRDDISNRHRWERTAQEQEVRVTLTRFVDPATGKPTT